MKPMSTEEDKTRGLRPKGDEDNIQKIKKHKRRKGEKDTGRVGSNHKPDEGKIKLSRLEIRTIPRTTKLHEGQIDWLVIREHRRKRSAS